MSTIVLTLPDAAVEALQVDPADAGATVLLAAAMKLYEAGRLSSGAAAELAGIPRPLFLAKLDAFGVDAFAYAADDFDAETRFV